MKNPAMAITTAGDNSVLSDKENGLVVNQFIFFIVPAIQLTDFLTNLL